MDADRRRRARLHAALGDPVRLAIVDELTVSDRSPGELARSLCLAPNLVAHHLDVLDRVGIVERITSAGDRRRRYARLVGDPMVELTRTIPGEARHVLFVCTHNSARSQLAAALWDNLTTGTAESAGTHPTVAVHTRAIAAGTRHGLDLTSARPSPLSSTVDADVVITVCDRAHEELGAPATWWHWSLPDPVERDTDAAFDATVDELVRRIRPFGERVLA